MPLEPGTLIGHYEVVGPLGSGGMGDVYCAIDPRLGRHVAIKIVSEAFKSDPDRLARFDREARTLASLNHPNIAQIYGIEDGALVMELLEGQPLRSVLADGPLPVRRAVDYAIQIARGLAAAHDRGVIHRDLKPENVFVLPDGHVKILDFGLARQVETALSSSVETKLQVEALTDAGTVLGTVGYMAPEQVRGQAVDARSDLFALGTVLYEMLAGHRAFLRNSGADTLTAILRDEPPDLAVARPDISAGLDRIVRHCLEKNPIERFQTARDVAFALEALSGSGSGPASVAGQAPPASSSSAGRAAASASSTGPATAVAWPRFAWAAAVALFAAGMLLQPLLRQMIGTGGDGLASEAQTPFRLDVSLPDSVSFVGTGSAAFRLAISPDGRWAVVPSMPASLAARREPMWLQSLTGLEPSRALESTAGGRAPFWSPDSRRVAYRDPGGLIRWVDIGLGTSGAFTGTRALGGAWGSTGHLVLFTAPPDTRIQEVSVSGSSPIDRFVPETPRQSYRFPSMLPGTDRFLFQFIDGDRTEASGIYIARLGSSDRQRLLPAPGTADTNVQVANGYLLVPRDGTLFAQPFDAGNGSLSGVPLVVADDVAIDARGAAAFAVSHTGVLVYQPVTTDASARVTLMNRATQSVRVVGDVADYSNVFLSPDDRQIAVSVLDPQLRTRDIYLVDIARGVRQRLTFDPADERAAVWTRDGRRVIFRRGNDLYSLSTDFTGTVTPVLVDGVSKDPVDVSPDGQRLLFRRSTEGGRNDLFIVNTDGQGEPVAVVASPFDDNYGSFSPGGSSIVYSSDESGQMEVYVLSLEGGGKMRISADGGTFPRWRDGREILYLGLDGMLTVVEVRGEGRTFEAGTSRPLFPVQVQPGPGRPFDVTADGSHILLNATARTRPDTLSVIVNWPALVRRTH